MHFVIAGQAFHWFEPEATRQEFRRILNPAGWVVLVWNERLVTTEGLLADYEALLKRYAPEYGIVDHRRIDANAIGRFFRHGNWRLARFDNEQSLDWDGLRGRLLSSSYAPLPGSPNHDPMMQDLAHIYREYQREGRVTLAYETKLYYGRTPA